ncbi:hypothetical protein JW868_00570 [Candidatus Woesearchaeota archaeon]|nr:hypothetical protein [Candidatus Woesearchaeota archaeon]
MVNPTTKTLTAIALLLTILALSSCTSTGQAAEPLKEITATSCNGDMLCEMNSAKITDGLTVDSGDTVINDNFLVRNGNIYLGVYSGLPSAFSIYLEADNPIIESKATTKFSKGIHVLTGESLFEENVKILGDLVLQRRTPSSIGRLTSADVMTKKLEVGDPDTTNHVVTIRPERIQISALAGEGNAYACIDELGRLFRSRNPCDQAR